MAILIGAQELSKSFSERALFQKISFSIETKERIGLIGPNGAGKSTLLSILAGNVSPDSGKISMQRGLRIGFLEQLPRFKPNSTVHESVMQGASDPDEWEAIALAQELMSRLDLTEITDSLVETLSGGWKKRVALARELLKQPDLLLLDEPTNHLDVESILWLEEFLANSSFATLTITHDRVFLQKVSNRIIELNRRYPAGILSVRGDYVAYLETKEGLLAAQESQETKLRNTLRRETEWLRRGPKARTTKQEARIQRAGALSEQVEDLGYRNASSTTRFDFRGVERNPKKLIHAEGISVVYGERKIIPKMDLLVTPKSRIGLLGANGCGKSTLIRVLLKLEQPNTGSVFHAENLKVAYFEQNRESLDPDLSVLRTVCPVGDYLDYAGNHIHVRTYLDRFLFSGNHVEMAVGKLSGGEQSRLLLAKLMLQESNLLVLDEPTNDLDMVTLDLLQDVLQDFKGAVILVTHDRYFLDQVANQILGFGVDARGERVIVPFANVEQWETWHESEKEANRILVEKPKASSSKIINEPIAQAVAEKKKRSFKEQREFEGMEAAIAKAEAQLALLTEESTHPEIVSNATKLLSVTGEMSTLQREIERLYARWAELS